MTAWSSKYLLLNLSTSAKNFGPFDDREDEDGYGNFEDEDGDYEDDSCDDEDEYSLEDSYIHHRSKYVGFVPSITFIFVTFIPSTTFICVAFILSVTLTYVDFAISMTFEYVDFVLSITFIYIDFALSLTFATGLVIFHHNGPGPIPPVSAWPSPSQLSFLY